MKVEASRHQAVFRPQPGGHGDAPAPPDFKRIHEAEHVIVRSAGGSSIYEGSSALEGVPRFADYQQNLGIIGALSMKVFQQKGSAGSLFEDHWAGRLLTRVFDGVWAFATGVAGKSSGGSPLVYSDAQLRTGKPVIEWHPHMQVFATLSESRTVSVHRLGDSFCNCTTQFLQCNVALGTPCCLAWKPNDLSGSLAVGFSHGAALWRNSSDRGWGCAWSVVRETDACPAVAWAPDGRSLAVACSSGTVRVWPHGNLTTGQPRGCVTLRRYFSGAVSDMRWNPDGSLLAVAHDSKQPYIRVWNTHTWGVALCVNICADAASPSLAWCNNDTLFGIAAGHLFELRGARSGSAGSVFGFEPTARTLQLPSLPDALNPDQRQQVAEVSVCPKTGNFVAIRLHSVAHVLIFQRVEKEGWAKQDLILWGLVAADGLRTDLYAVKVESEATAFADAIRSYPIAVGFAAANSSPFSSQFQDRDPSVLAVYWEFGDGAPEVRTYPLQQPPATPSRGGPIGRLM